MEVFIMENIGIENLAQDTYEFLGHTELDTVFSNNFHRSHQIDVIF